MRSVFILTLLFFGLQNYCLAGDVCFYSKSQGRVEFVANKKMVPRGSNVRSQCLPDYRLNNAVRLKSDARLAVYFDKYDFLNVLLLDEVPKEYADIAKQNSMPVRQVLIAVASGGHLARPEDIELNGTVREIQLATVVGNIKLRWPRKVESVFGRTPERAMVEAANTVSRTLKQAGFPQNLKNLYLEWNVVFMDENMPEQQIPADLIKNCNPGWMTTPSNIYIVAQRVARGCSGRTGINTRVSDAKLAEILLHEMGHVVEYKIIGQVGGKNKMRSEGFATWFEMYAAKQSALVSTSQLKQENKVLAKRAIENSPDKFVFNGTAEDYARASLYFQVLYAKRGVAGIIAVYDSMRKEKVDFVTAIKRTMNWSDKKLAEEIDKVLNS